VYRVATEESAAAASAGRRRGREGAACAGPNQSESTGRHACGQRAEPQGELAEAGGPGRDL